MPSQKILAVDPGQTTGVLYAERTGPKEFRILDSRALPWESRFWLHRCFEALTIDLVVVEDFRLYSHKALDMVNNDFKPVRIIGQLELSANLFYVPIVYQMASLISNVQVLNEHMPSLARSQHVRDAYKHLRYYILMTRKEFDAS